MERVDAKNIKLEVLTTRKNGDCLFSALAHQLFGSHPYTRDNSIHCNRLRTEVAVYIGKNSREFNKQIASNYRDKYDNQSMILNEDQLVKKFCKEIRIAGEWGGGETIKAVAELYNVSILIYMEDGDSFRINQKENVIKELAIVYRKGLEGYNHYDSFIKIIGIKENKHDLLLEKEKVEQKDIQGEEEYQLSIKDISEEQDIGYIVKLNEIINQELRTSTRDDLRIATWNVRGCANQMKRESIDEALEIMKIDIAGIQETHLSSGKGETKQYHWWNAGKGEGNRESRGVAIVINKKCNLRVSDFKIYSDSTCSIKLIWANIPITLITAHISSETDPRNKTHLAEVHKAISNAQPNTSTILIGDLNAHFGITDTGKSESKWIGPKTFHQNTNENGKYFKMLMEIFHLRLHNTWSQSRTVLTTWSNGITCSQLDHIMSTYNIKAINYIKAKWLKSVDTDHKILYGWLKRKEIEIKDNVKQKQHNKPKKMKWSMSALNDPLIKEKYENEIQVALNELDANIEHPNTVEGKWEEIKEVLTRAANNSLVVQRSPLTPRRRKAIAKQKKVRFLRQRYLKDVELNIDLINANISRKQADRNHFLDKCSKFIQELRKIHPQQRIKEMYKLIKEHKALIEKKNVNYIPMSKWEEVLLKETGNKIDLIKEHDGKPLPPPPSLEQITKWIRVGKKGRAPGIDNINLDLLANAPLRLIKEIEIILREAWEKNEIPLEWSTALQIPIPKIKNAKEVSNYRRISLCTVTYKLYTKYILYCLDEILPETPSYQAAFLPERSTDDHTFTVGRILEERWRSGSRTYVVTLDLEKAFDSIKHEAIITILKQNKVPHKLINRIIKTSLNEDTMIQWCGQRTKRIIKGIGVKQGCPLSPRLFNIAINEVLQTVAEILPFINLQQKNTTTLPLILVFADDVIIVADKEIEIQQIIDELISALISIGLKINPEKCQMLVRDPMEIIPSTWKAKIGYTPIAIVEKLKYLGIIITNKLNRRTHTKERIKKAYAITHSILPFLQRYHLPWDLTKIIYETLIVPTVTYGMKTTVLTKANRNSLRNMERDLIGLLAATCHPKVSNMNASILLNRRTIIRKITMLRIRYWGHIIRRAEDHILKTVLYLRTKKRKVGRPCLTWISNLDKDKNKFENLGVDWSQVLLDKKATAGISKEIYAIPDDTDSEDEEKKTVQ